jgi:transglutaminase-like putative cysteine protease
VKFRVTHTTQYAYAESVPASHSVAHLRPRNTDLQTCSHSELVIHPKPAQRRDRVDFFGNNATWFTIDELHRKLSIEAVSHVETTPQRIPNDKDGPAWDDFGKTLRAQPNPESLLARQYVLESPQSPVSPELADYAKPCFPLGESVVHGAIELTHQIFHDFIFDSYATTVGTPVREVLDHRRGVCQDFAHLQIACLRSLGLAARYVSGYVLTHPPAGQARLIGGDASHAWVSVYIPSFGWLDLDPTNGLAPNGEHITLAWGRDYDDLTPLRGVMTGSRQHTLYYSVDVEPHRLPHQPRQPPRHHPLNPPHNKANF